MLQALANLASTMGLSQKELLSYVWINAMQQAQVCSRPSILPLCLCVPVLDVPPLLCVCFWSVSVYVPPPDRHLASL